MRRLIVLISLGVFALSGCSSTKQLLFGDRLPPEAPTIAKSAEKRWVLIKNPSYGSQPSEPEYVWVEEDNIPTTVNTVIFGKKSVIAPPEIVSRYGAPPGGGKISPLQGGGYVQAAKGQPLAPPSVRASQQDPFNHVVASPLPEEATSVTPRGYVIFVDQKRIVI